MRAVGLIASFVAAMTLAGCFEGKQGPPSPPGAHRRLIAQRGRE